MEAGIKDFMNVTESAETVTVTMSLDESEKLRLFLLWVTAAEFAEARGLPLGECRQLLAVEGTTVDQLLFEKLQFSKFQGRM